jgi:hypothetical protein
MLGGGRWVDSSQRAIQVTSPDQGENMAVHTISLFGAIVLLLLAVLLLFVIGPFGLLVLILAGLLFWWAFGPGSRTSTRL